MNIQSKICFSVILILLLSIPAQAFGQDDQITVDVEIARNKVYVGDDVSYQILVRGSNNPPQPEIEFPSSVRARFHGRTSQQFTSMRVINGRNRTVTDRRYSYQYTLTCVESGTVTIPAPNFEINGQRYTGQPISFESLFPVKSDADHLEISIPRDEIYLNETIEVECVWWIGDQTSEYSFSSSSFPSSFEIRGLEPINPGRRLDGFALSGQAMAGSLETGLYQGKEMSRLSFRFTITPTEVGEFDLGPLRAVFTRHTGAGNNYRAYVQTDPILVAVNRVPSENRPGGYSGAIGAFQLKAQASNTKVNVGDPIELTLRVNGREPMIGVEDAPNLSRNDQFADDFKLSSEGWREVLPRQSGNRTYETTIRALHDGVRQIPPIELPSFNTTTGQYKIYRSNPIDLSVTSVQEITLSDAIVTGGTNSEPSRPSVERIELTRAAPGLWAHGQAEEMLDDPGFSITGAFRNPIWITVIASGPTLFALSLVVFVSRGFSDPHSQQLRNAWRRCRLLDRTGQHAEALRVYLAAALDINEEAITADDASKLPIEAADAQAIAACLQNDEQGDFAGNLGSEVDQDKFDSGLLARIHARVKDARRALS